MSSSHFNLVSARLFVCDFFKKPQNTLYRDTEGVYWPGNSCAPQTRSETRLLSTLPTRRAIAERVFDKIYYNQDLIVDEPILYLIREAKAIPLSDENFKKMRALFQKLVKEIGQLIDSNIDFLAFDAAIASGKFFRINHLGSEIRACGIAWPIVRTSRDIMRLYSHWMEGGRYPYAIFVGGLGFEKIQELRNDRTLKLRRPWLFVRDSHEAVLFVLQNNGAVAYALHDEPLFYGDEM